MPKNVGLDENVRIMIRSLVEAQTAVDCALNESDCNERIRYLSVVELHFKRVQTVTKVLYDYSTNNTKGCRFISTNQRIELIDKMYSIGKQLYRWINSTRKEAANDASK